MHIYPDGKLDASWAAGTDAPMEPWYTGKDVMLVGYWETWRGGKTGPAPRHNFAGRIDEGRIPHATTRLLHCILFAGCAMAILAPANGADTPVEGLVAYWSFDEGEGGTCRDTSPNRIPLTLKGPKWIKGKCGYALHFDGKGDWVEGVNDGRLNLKGPLTIAFWVKPMAGGQQFLVSKYGWTVFLGGDPSRVHWHTRKGDNRGWSPFFVSQEGLQLNTWSHVAVVVDTVSGNGKEII